MATFDPALRVWWDPQTDSVLALAIGRTTITNATWREAAKQGKVASGRISAKRRDGVVLAQYKLCNPFWGMDSDLTDEDGGGFAELHKRARLAREIFEDVSGVVEKFSHWKHASGDEISIMQTSALLTVKLQQDLQASVARYERLGSVVPKIKSMVKDRLFRFWVWQLAAAFYEAGGSVTMTSPGAGENTNYSGAFYLFALRVMRDEADWPFEFTPKSFGARLYRALTDLRKVQTGKSGQEFSIIAKGKVLRFPT